MEPVAGRKTVYLTFDDGPEASTTPFVLDTLDRFGCKATFFMVGENVGRHPGLVEEIAARGHAVGNHAMRHLKGLKTSTRRYIADIEKESALLPTRLFRPPDGFMRPRQYLELRRRYRIVMFDVVTRDYDPRLSPNQVMENLTRHVGDGSIVVFHDSLKARRNLLGVLPKALEWLKQNGYECRPLPMD